MKVNSKEQLAALVRDQRKYLKLSQAELALKTKGVSRQWVVELEAGRSNPDFLTLVRLTVALGLTLNVSRGDTASLSIGSPDLDDVLDRLKKP